MTAKEFFGDWSEVIPFDELNDTLNMLGKTMQKHEIVPPKDDIFKAFLRCPYDKLNVVFLGQSPYPQKGIATGLAFGNKEGTHIDEYSPSLRVIKESVIKYCSNDLPFGYVDDLFPTLERWAEQGILLLNSALTINVGEPDSHLGLWRTFISKLIKNISTKKPDTIFVLFGETAKSFIGFIDNNNYICSPHPAYCARKEELLPDVFSQIDKRMLDMGKELIWWI